MTWAATILITLIFVEILIRLPVANAIGMITQIGRKSASILSSKNISDHWKEKVSAAYSIRLFKQTLLLAGYFVIDIIVVGFLVVILEYYQIGMVDFLSSLTGIVFISITATFYYLVRKYCARGSL